MKDIMYMLKAKKAKQQGFTLVEVLVVIVVLGIGMGALVSLFTSIQSVQRGAAYMNIAAHAARTEIERLRTTDFNSIQAGGTYPFSQPLPSSLPADSTGTITVSTPANATSSKQVNATVTYKVGTLDKQVTITAYIDPPTTSP